VWVITLPILVILGCIGIWAVPSLIHTNKIYQLLIQITMSLMILGVILERLLSLPGNVLRGMNLGYKAMGLNTISILVGGFGSIAVIKLGWSIVGLAVVGIIGMVLTESIRFFVARKEIVWFRPRRPKKNEFVNFLRLSGWLFLSALGALLLNSSDVLIVGVLLGPSSAAIYATTGMVLSFIMSIATQMLTSGSPGISDICGRKDFLRLDKVRTELHILAFSLMTLVGVGVTILNRYFLQLWVGKGYYAGNTVNFLLIMIASQSLLCRLDGLIVDSVLDFKSKAISSLLGGSIIVGLGGLMTYQWGFWGVALAAWLTYLGLWLYFLTLIRKRTGIGFGKYIHEIFWPMSLFAILMCGVSLLPLNPNPANWIMFILYGVITASGVMVLLFLLMKKNHKALIYKRLQALLIR
jgi:O-antigen/teichoic acid export membrane protein